MLKTITWADIDEQVLAETNTHLRVFSDGRLVWDGFAAVAVENPSGSLSLRRTATVDGHVVPGEVVLLQAGRWDRVEYGGTVIDPEQIAEQKQQKAEAQAANRAMIAEQKRKADESRIEALTKAGLADPQANRAGRRHPSMIPGRDG